MNRKYIRIILKKNILISGASTGIGAATALALAPGNRLFVHYNQSLEEANQVATQVQELGGEAYLLQANLSNKEGCEALFDQLSTHCDKLDVLINNAGGLVQRHAVEEISWELMEEIFALNTFSTFYLTKLCIPLLKKGVNPCIINMTSVAMRHGAPSATVYGASKGAIDSFTRGAAKELAPEIRVNAIAPGVILTPFHDRYTSAERMEAMRKLTPLGRHGESEHIAKAVAFLIDNDFITGETLDINGGSLMR